MAKKSSVANKSRKSLAGNPKAPKKLTEEKQVKVRKEPGKKSAKSSSIQLDVKHQLKIQKALYEIADAAGSARDMGAFYKRLHKIIGKLMYAKNFYIAEYDQDSDLITWPYHADEKDTQEATWTPQRLRNEKGVTAHVIRTGEIFYTRQDSKKAFRAKNFKVIGTLPEDAIVVPLKSNDSALGAVGVQIYSRKIAYSEQDVEVLTFVANHIATELTRARAIEETRRRNTELQIINSIQQGLAAQMDFQSIVDLVGDKLRMVFNTPNLGIQWYEKDKNLLHVLYAYERGKRLRIEPGPPRKNGVFNRHLKSREPVVFNNPKEYKKLHTALFPGAKRGKSYISVPIISSDQVLGNVDMENFERENAFGESEIRLLTTISASLGTALENARLYQETKRRFKETENLRAANIALTQSLDLEDILGTLLGFLHQAIEYDTGSVFLLEGDSKLTAYAIHGYETWAKDSTPPIGASYEFKKLPHMRAVIEKQTTVVIPDVTKHPHWIIAPAGKHIRNWMAIPLIAGGKTIGLYSLDKSRVNYFTQDHQRLAENLAAQAAIAIQNATLFKNQSIAREQAETLRAVTQALSSTLSLRDVFDLILTELQKVVPYDSCSVHQLEGKESVIVGGRGFPNLNELIGVRFQITPQNVGAKVIKSRKPYIVDDVSAGYPDFRKRQHGGGRIHGWLGVPLLFGDRLIGMLALDKYEKSFYTPEHATLALAFAAQAAVAIENARLFETEHKAREQAETNARQMAAINRVAQAASSTLDLKSVLDIFAHEMADLINAKSVGIGLLNEAQTEIKVVAYHSRAGGGDVLGQIIPLEGNRATRQVIKTGKAVLIDDPQNTPLHNEAARAIMRSLNIRCILIAPILSRGRVIGTIGHDLDEPNRVFTPDEVRLAQTVANQMSGVIENVRLFDEAQRLLKETEERNQELSIINNLQELLASKLDIQAIYELIGEKLCKVFDVEVIDIVLYDQASNLITMPYSYEKGDRTVIDPRKPYGFRKHVLETRKHLLVNQNFKEMSRQYGNPLLTGEWPRSALFVPLLTESKAIGVISIQDLDRENAFTESDVRLLQTLAGAISVALENARLFDETQRLLKETEQRNAELAIINSVQAALAAKLDMQGIYDAVGDKIRNIFDAQSVILVTYEPASNLMVFPYVYEKGKRLVQEPLPLDGSGIMDVVIMRREPIMINTDMTAISEELTGHAKGTLIGEGSEMVKSRLDVPMIVGREARGAISLQNVDRENAFSESDLRLLQTLANSMGVALENARLFDETQRLLKETEQHNSELAIITSIQRELVAELDTKAMYDLVGERIHELYPEQAIVLSSYDYDKKVTNYHFMIEDNKRLTPEPTPFSYVTEQLITTRKHLLVNNNVSSLTEKGVQIIKGTQQSSSVLFTPLVIGSQVRGVIQVADNKRENFFEESDTRLMNTLASSLSVALENARLFEETQRLLNETERRNAELGMINSVQQALVSNLDIKAIFKSVGRKLTEIFQVQSAAIYTINLETHMMAYEYAYESGKEWDIGSKPTTTLHDYIINDVLKTRKSFVINTNFDKFAEKHPDYTSARGQMPKSMCAVPIVIGKNFLTGISLQNLEVENYFGDNAMRLLETISNAMSIAIENARLFGETQRLLKETEKNAEELKIINQVGEEMSRRLDVKTITRTVGDNVTQIFKADATSILLLDEPNNQIISIYEFDEGNYIENIKPFPLGKGLTSHVINTRKALVLGSSEEAKLYGVFYPPEAMEANPNITQSYLGVPIITGERVIGVISVNTYAKNAYTNDSVRLLATVANNMGVALENANLFDETQQLLKVTEQRASELSAISTVSQALVAETELDSLIQLIGSQMRDIFKADIAYLALLNQNVIEFPYQHGDNFSALKMGEGLTSTILRSGEPLRLNQNMDEKSEALGVHRVGRRALSYLGVPIKSGKETIGVLSVQSTAAEEFFDEDDLRLLTTIAANAGAAINTAQLHAETQRRAREMATLAEIGNDIAATRELEPVLERIAFHAKEILHVRDIAIYLREGNELHVPVALGTYTDEIKALVLKVGEGLSGSIAKSGLAEIVNYPTRDPRVTHVAGTPEEDDAVEAMMVAPLSSRGEIIGVVTVWRPHESGLFTQPDLDFLTSVARQTAIAIESARLYLETQRRAREMSALVDVGRDISSSLDAKTVLESIAHHALELLDGDLSALFLPEADGNTFRAIAAVGEEAEELRNDTIKLGEGLLGSIALSKVGEIVNDSNSDPRTVLIAGTDEIPDEHLIAVPLLANDELKGLMSVWRHGKDTEFAESELEFMQNLARQAVIAVQNAQFFAETQRLLRETEEHAAELSIINSVGQTMTQEIDLQTMIDSVGDKLRRSINVENIGIGLYEEGTNILHAPYVYHHGERIQISASKLNSFNLRMAKMGRSLVLNRNVAKHWRKIGSNLTVGDMIPKSFIMIPMLAGKELVGGITIQDFEHENAYSESFVRLIETIAANMGTAVQNARLFDEITRRKEYFEVLFHNNPVAVVTIDNNANVTSWNPAAEFLFGYSQEEAIGQNVDTLVANREELREEAIIYSNTGLQETDNAFQVLAKRTRKDGTLVDVELSGVPIMVQGKKMGMYALYHDITELERAREEAIAANDAKSAFLATMSHEIRTPMNAVIGMSGLLMDTPLNKEQLEYAETIRNSGDTLLAIINDILDFSKIEAGKMEVESQAFDLRDCVESALDLTSGRAIEKGLDIAYIIDDDVPTGIKSDVTRLRQILINLLSNAIKFTEKGEVVLTVKKGRARDEIQFTVTDTGIGISENHMKRLFQSFSQADSSTTRRFGGTGLGLAISKRLAEIMGGTMYAESGGHGQGSRFIFTIHSKPTDVEERRAGRNIKGIQSILKDKAVLIVDDNATNRRILMLQTTKWGMKPQETEFPRDALQWIKDGNKFDLLITDMHMPELDGLMLTREIRKIVDEKTLPIILLTSLGRRELGADEVNFSAYLSKPLKPSALYDALAGLFATDQVKSRTEPVTSPGKSLLDPETASRHPLRILLAEDNTINQKLALRILEQMGYRVDVASNGLEAVESIERQAYDVILMDVQMPEMDGLDATRTIRKIDGVIQPHIIAMTANALEGDREMCIAAGMNDYVSKPIRINELINALMKAQRR